MAIFDEQDGQKVVDVGIGLFESVASFAKKTLELAGNNPVLTGALLFIVFVGRAQVDINKLFKAKVG